MFLNFFTLLCHFFSTAPKIATSNSCRIWPILLTRATKTSTIDDKIAEVKNKTETKTKQNKKAVITVLENNKIN